MQSRCRERLGIKTQRAVVIQRDLANDRPAELLTSSTPLPVFQALTWGSKSEASVAILHAA